MYRMTKNEDISNPFEVTERKTLAVQDIVDKTKYLTILFSSQHYTHLDTCPNYHPNCTFVHESLRSLDRTHAYIIVNSNIIDNSIGITCGNDMIGSIVVYPRLFSW